MGKRIFPHSTGLTSLVVGLLILPVVALVMPFKAYAPPGILYAIPSGLSNGSCDSWGNACSLHYALSVANSGEEIWVKEGVHYPGSTRTDTFSLKEGVAIYGGFTGNETSREQRDWNINLTILSGDIDHNDITDPYGVITNIENMVGENTFHVIVSPAVLETAVLDGFIVTGGQANGAWADPCDGQCGGGAYIKDSSPTLSNIIFSGNSADLEAGWGGGVYNLHSATVMNNVVFTNNLAGASGGGIYAENSAPILTNVVFNSNSAAWGGGMANVLSNPILHSVTFHSNNANGVGGGMANDKSSPTLINVVFIGNNAGSGGGMENYDNSNPTLTNVVFSGNNVYSGMGGGMENSNSSPILNNVTVSGNKASMNGGGMANINSSPVIRNTLFWKNKDSGPSYRPPASIWNLESTPLITFSLVANCGSSGAGWKSECGSDGGNNVNNNDVFNTVLVNPPNPEDAPTDTGDLHLISDSPAIDMGNNAFVTDILTDLDGNMRIFNGLVDIGAYEWHYPTLIFLPLVMKTIP